MMVFAKLAALYIVVFSLLLVAVKSDQVPLLNVLAVAIGLGVVVSACHLLLQKILK